MRGLWEAIRKAKGLLMRRDLSAYGAAFPAPSARAVAWLVERDGPYDRVMASTRIRCYDISRALNARGILSLPLRWGPGWKAPPPAVVLQKYYLPKDALAAARSLRERGSRVYFDININCFELEGEIPALLVTEAHVSAARALVAEVDGVIVSSPYLLGIARKHHPHAYFLPEPVPLPGAVPRLRLPEGRRRTLVWSGYSVKAAELNALAPVLERLKERFDLELLVVSESPRHGVRLPVPVRWKRFCIESVHADLAEGQVFVSPRDLANTYNLAHSFTKIGLPMAAGLPVVASPVPSYIGSPAVLCETDTEWETAISALLGDEAAYAATSAESYEFTKREYSLESVVSRFEAIVGFQPK